MSFRLAAPWSLAAGLLLAVVVLVFLWFTHRSLAGVVDRRARLIFTLLRSGAAALLVLLILDPVLTREHLPSKGLRVAILIDRSRSMSVRDSLSDRARFSAAADFLHRRKTGLAPLLEEEGFKVSSYAFDTTLRPARASEEQGTSRPRGDLTDLAGAIAGLASATPKAETVAVVLLSDGVSNAGGDAVAAARELGIPIHTVGFGSSGKTREGPVDLAVTNVDAPETAFANNTVVAEVAIRSTGYDLEIEEYREAKVILEEGDAEIGFEVVTFRESGIPVRVPFRFVPEGEGPHVYKVRVAVRGDEAFPENNSRTFALRVQDRRASVLYYDATMRWEAKYLRDCIARDPALDLTSVIHSGQGRLLVYGDTHGANLSRGLPGTREDFEKFDVVILGDVRADVLPAGSLALLRARVESGGGLLTLGGYNAYGPGGYARTPLADILPVELADSDAQYENEVTTYLSPEGRVHPILSGLTSFFSGQDRPVLKGLTRVGNAKPGAEVLATGRGADGERVGAVLAAQRYGEGPVVSFTGDTSWVWFRSPEFGGEDGLYRRFWGQILRWLIEKDAEVEQTGERLVIEVSRPSYRIGESIRIRARVRDAEGRPDPDAAISAKLVGPEGESSLEMAPLTGEPGVFGADRRAKTPGSYRAAAHIEGTDAEAEFVVETTSVEMDVVGIDLLALNSIAQTSGGRYHELTDAEGVVEDIRGSLIGLLERQETDLASTPLFFLLFLGLMTAEWVMRRRRNLL